jgi:TRAP-type C4-dicarboxylate transport system permease small subunit
VASPVLLAAGFAVLLALAAARAACERRGLGRGVFRFAHHVEVGSLALLLVTLVVLGAAQIYLRNVHQSGLLWADPLMRHIVLWLGALGAALATAHVQHISVDALSRFLPARWRRARRLVVYGATSVVSCALLVATVRLIVDERNFGEVAFLGIRTWVLQLVLPFSFGLIAYRILVALFLAREPLESGAEVAEP